MKSENTKLKYFIKENTWLSKSSLSDHGWGNGYVLIPINHPFYEMYYEEINKYIDVHGGLTFSEHYSVIKKYPELPVCSKTEEYWVVGFDTCHCNDNSNNWTKEAVLDETLKLVKQLEEAWNKPLNANDAIYRLIKTTKIVNISEIILNQEKECTLKEIKEDLLCLLKDIDNINKDNE